MSWTCSLIVATTQEMGIGYQGDLSFKIPEDLKYFYQKTTQVFIDNNGNILPNLLIMGRNTWDSLPNNIKPLKKRVHIVLTHRPFDISDEHQKRVYQVNSWDKLDTFILENKHKFGYIFVIGGSQIYRDALVKGHVNKIYHTLLLDNPKSDVFMPPFNSGSNYFQLTYISPHLRSSEGYLYQYLSYTHYPKYIDCFGQKQSVVGEYQYLKLIEKVLREGETRQNRTGIPTRSIFGAQCRYDLRQSFPLLTTKKMFTRGILEELLWFLKGQTDNQILKDKKVHIWDGNSSREALDNLGLTHYETGDCGPIYGFNFRHFGADYKDCKTDYTGRGIDQLQHCIDLIKNNSTSRRILISLWNPLQMEEVSLPACHVLYQFYLKDKYLSCSMYQRSGDLGLGVPFNIASASFLTHILAHLTGNLPGELIHTIGDLHIYENHMNALETQVKRIPKPFPQLKIKERGQNKVEDYLASDFLIEGYTSYPKLSMPMAV